MTCCLLSLVIIIIIVFVIILFIYLFVINYFNLGLFARFLLSFCH